MWPHPASLQVAALLLIGVLYAWYLTRHCITSKQKKLWIILEVRWDTSGRNLGSLPKLLVL